MKTYFKFLSRNKLYTFINLLGLSVSLMFVILIANYVTAKLTLDTSVEYADRIYTLANEDSIMSGYWNAQHVRDRYPEVEEACAITGGGKTPVKVEDKEYGARILFADTTFFDFFSIRLIEGDSKDALKSRDNIVISNRFAKEVFGTENPIGKSIAFNSKERTIVGIMPEIKNSVLPTSDIVINFMNMDEENSSVTSVEMNNAGGAVVFFRERPGADLQAKTDDILAFFKTYFWPYRDGAWSKVILVPFKDIYFSELGRNVLNGGNWAFVVLLMSVGIVILFFSVVNYINLTVAQTGFRAKEMATRRLLGSSRGALFGKLILESFLMVGVAFGVGFLLAVAVQSFANTLLESDIALIENFNGIYLVGYVVLIVVVALLSGIIPATIISNFQPIEVVRGTFRRKTSMVYGKILIVFQNFITITLIGGSIAMIWQVNHLINAPMGYNYKNVINIYTWGGFESAEQVNIVAQELKKLPFVELVGQSQGTPVSGGNNNTYSYGPDRMISFQTFIGDSAYFKILGLKIKTDFNLAKKGYYFNEQAFREIGVDENTRTVKLGKEFETEFELAGVIENFRVRSVLSRPTAFRVMILNSFLDESADWRRFPWEILVKVSDNTDKQEAIKEVRAVVERITGSNQVVLDYLGNYLKNYYSEQQRTSDIMLIFTLIAVLISSLGLLAMSTYFIQQRRMEVAVRKVFGSTSNEALVRLVSNFMRMMAVAFVISVPVIWYGVSEWLSNFSYKISLSPLIFLGAGTVATIIAFITVFWQSRNAANENPITRMKR